MFLPAVVTNSSDPEGRGRVRLRVPQVLGPAESGWAVPLLEGDPPGPGARVWVTLEANRADRFVYLPLGVAPAEHEHPHEHPHDHPHDHPQYEHDHPYSLTGHDHDAAYSPLGHGHDYSSPSHLHDARYPLGIVGFTSRTDIFSDAATLAGTVILTLNLTVTSGRRYRFAAHARWSTNTSTWVLRQELRVNGDSRDSAVEVVDRTDSAATHRVSNEFFFTAGSTGPITVEVAAARVAGTFSHTQHRASSLAPSQLSAEDVGIL